jgi:putative transposase
MPDSVAGTLDGVLPAAGNQRSGHGAHASHRRVHLEYPFAGSRMLRDMLMHEGHQIGRKHVATLMKKIGIKALYKKPDTSRRHAKHPVYPYLLRNLEINRPNQVFAADIMYIPMRRGFVYLFAVMDWASRRVLSWRVSNTLTTDFCIEAEQEAVAHFGVPDIFNTDQGSQFTSLEFTQRLKNHGIAISMDGKGGRACSDGATTCSSSGFGNRSSTRRCICAPTRA